MLGYYSAAPLVTQSTAPRPYYSPYQPPLDVKPTINGRSVDPAAELYDRIEEKGFLNFFLGGNDYKPLSHYFKRIATTPVEVASKSYGYVKSFFKREVEAELTVENNEIELGLHKLCSVNGSKTITFGMPDDPNYNSTRLLSWDISIAKSTNTTSPLDETVCTAISEAVNNAWNFSSVDISKTFTLLECCYYNHIYPPIITNFLHPTLNVSGVYPFDSYNYTVQINYDTNATLNWTFHWGANLEEMYSDFLHNGVYYYYGSEYNYVSGTLTDFIPAVINSIYKKKNKDKMINIVVPSVVCPLAFCILAGFLAYKMKPIATEKLKEWQEEKQKNMRAIYLHTWPKKERTSLLFLTARKIRYTPALLRKLQIAYLYTKSDLYDKVMTMPAISEEERKKEIKQMYYLFFSRFFVSNAHNDDEGPIEIVIHTPTERTPLING